MTRSPADRKYLKIRNGWYYYYRSVPAALRAMYPGLHIVQTLNTKSEEVAKMRRDGLAAADDAYWADLKLALKLEGLGEPIDTAMAERRYEIAKARALAAGFAYRPAAELADPSMIAEVVHRSLAIGGRAGSDGRVNPVEADALLGIVEEPKVTVSTAMELYKTKIMANTLRTKSPGQKKLWEQTKDRSLRYFIEVIGDIPISEITREIATRYYDWWNDQLSPSDPEAAPKKPKTASKHFGDMRSLYAEYFRYKGVDGGENPFRDLNFKTTKRAKRLPFEPGWVEQKILVPGSLDGLREDIFLAILMLVETGCRPGEIVNLQPEHIRLDADIPHIRVRPVEEGSNAREIKNENSIREIPLVGVSLEAAKRAPEGFPNYHDKSSAFSAAANKALRTRGLLPTKKHVIYSFRHSIEKRMQEANLDYALRCLVMGHNDDRPKYGDGGSLAYRKRELMRIAHAVPDDFFVAFDAQRAAGVIRPRRGRPPSVQQPPRVS
ncbi:MAG: DUF6538 domain-containing protein [Pseudomonadota bacterium]